MQKFLLKLAMVLSVLLLPTKSIGQPSSNETTLRISAFEAKRHIHEFAIIHGPVTKFSRRQTGQFVYTVIFELGGIGTNQVFGVVFPEADKFTVSKLSDFQGAEILVSGMIRTNKFGTPMVVIKSLDDISIGDQGNQATPNPMPVVAAIPKAVLLSTTNKIPSWLADILNDPSMNQTIGNYKNAKVTRVEPDGLTIQYRTETGGVGGRKIPFVDLPLDIQNQYNYSPQNAAAYVAQQKASADFAEAEKRRQELQDQQDEAEAESAAAQILYNQAKLAYDQAQENYNLKIKLGTLQAAQRAAAAQEMQAKQQAYQTALQQQQTAIQQQQTAIQQQQLIEMQNQTFINQQILNSTIGR